MMRIVSIYIMCVLLVLVVAGCGGDSDDSIVKPGADPYRTLTVRDNVLFNLQKSWNESNLTRFDDLLDDDFVFHFNAAGVENGVAAAQWDRLAEMAVANNMFDPDFNNPDQVPVIEIFLSLWYAQGEDSWTDVLPDQDQYPGETWHSKVCWYDLKVKTNDFSYIALNLQATVILRQPDGEGGFWQIVSWSDDTGSESMELEGAGSYVEGGTTWGTVKALYDEYAVPTVRDDVLLNLEKSWNERRIDHYNELLDEDFVFHFSVADFTNGHVSVPQWDRLTEMAAAVNMFDPNFSHPGQTPVSTIDLTLTYTEGEDLWTDVLPDQDQYPGETWYSKVFMYTMTVNTADASYVANDLQATAIVRQSDGEGGVWRIVTWSDDTAALLHGLSRTPLAAEMTWGVIKTLYAN